MISPTVELQTRSAYSKPALWGTLLAALVVTLGSLKPFHVRDYAFLHWRIQIFGAWYTTPHALMHILAFGLLAVLAWLISQRWTLRLSAIAGALLLGLAIEWLQLKVYPGIKFETWDLCNDAAGVCLGVLIAYGCSAARSRA